MSAPDAPPHSHVAAQPDGGAYRDIVVVGGGCYGGYYVRQLERARTAGKIEYERVRVIDRDPGCAVARNPLPPRVEVVGAEWREFFRGWLPSAGDDDAIVPSPLMPHLLYEWVRDRAAARWPAREIATRPLPAAPPTPWTRAVEDGTTYASYATWMCPINCIEPRRCPHTRGARDWTMPAAARALVAAAVPTGESLLGPVIFHCTHRAFGVGMIDARDVVAADAFVSAAASESPASVLVATVSHCHGAFNVLHVGPRPLNRSHA
jgi:hypothetical protein